VYSWEQPGSNEEDTVSTNIDAEHTTIACEGCGAEAGEQCTYPCLSWVTREEIELLPRDVKVIADHRDAAGRWCLWSAVTVSPYYPHTTCPEGCPTSTVADLDTASSASSQHYIDTGRYLPVPTTTTPGGASC
jgi:hypothetical protein